MKLNRSRKLRQGDKVVVIAGNSKGQTGTILRIAEDRVVVQGVNLRKKHVRPTQENPKGGILEIEKSIHLSNVMACDEEGNAVKLKHKVDSKGEKQLVFTQNGKETVFRSVKKQSAS
ncbi:MAG: 50S ribosomal protein L24 [Chlamydiia bacterium]|nr:50S ribosomal protein L24 [Chlamydiia bacterium]